MREMQDRPTGCGSSSRPTSLPLPGDRKTAEQPSSLGSRRHIGALP
jgi:hypothetical protein